MAGQPKRIVRNELSRVPRSRHDQAGRPGLLAHGIEASRLLPSRTRSRPRAGAVPGGRPARRRRHRPLARTGRDRRSARAGPGSETSMWIAGSSVAVTGRKRGSPRAASTVAATTASRAARTGSGRPMQPRRAPSSVRVTKTAAGFVGAVGRLERPVEHSSGQPAPRRTPGRLGRDRAVVRAVRAGQPAAMPSRATEAGGRARRYRSWQRPSRRGTSTPPP